MRGLTAMLETARQLPGFRLPVHHFLFEAMIREYSQANPIRFGETTLQKYPVFHLFNCAIVPDDIPLATAFCP